MGDDADITDQVDAARHGRLPRREAKARNPRRQTERSPPPQGSSSSSMAALVAGASQSILAAAQARCQAEPSIISAAGGLGRLASHDDRLARPMRLALPPPTFLPPRPAPPRPAVPAHRAGSRPCLAGGRRGCFSTHPRNRWPARADAAHPLRMAAGRATTQRARSPSAHRGPSPPVRTRYHAKWANALLASAMRCTFSRFV
jgi:hypothetical protein